MEIYCNFSRPNKESPVPDILINKQERIFETYDDSFESMLPSEKEAKILYIGWKHDLFCSFLEKKGFLNIDSLDLEAKSKVDMESQTQYCFTKVKNLSEFLKKNEKYDLIAMNKVIEHIPKSKITDYLRLLGNSLNKKGMLVLSTPNMAAFSGLFNRFCDFTHEVGFTEKSLFQILQETGFRRINIFTDHHKFRFRIKNILWGFFRKVWFNIIKLIYLIELGENRPHLLSKLLIASAQKLESIK